MTAGMSDTFQKLVVYVGGVLAVGAIGGVFAMWNTLNRMDAQKPLQEQLREVELEQLRQGLILNSQKIDVTNAELRELEARVRRLEDP